MNIENKICKKCGRELPIEKYAIHTITGYISKTCKDCYNADRREKKITVQNFKWDRFIPKR